MVSSAVFFVEEMLHKKGGGLEMSLLLLVVACREVHGLF